MVRTLGNLTIATGEPMEVVVVECPDADWRERALSLLSHKGPEWQYHMARALDGATDALETRFHLGIVDGRPVANVMTVERHGIGIVGHVYTTPERRRQGICKAVMSRQLADFRARGGHVLLLGTGFESTAYWIYHGFGFRSLRGGFMRYATPGNKHFEERWFAARPARVVGPRWEHWPLVSLFGSVTTGERLRVAAWRVLDIENLEWGYCRFRRDTEEPGGPQGSLLQTEDGAVVGLACRHALQIGPDPHPWPEVWLTDLDVHPNFADDGPRLLAALPRLEEGREIALADPASHTASCLEGAGFRRAGHLTNFVRTACGLSDVVLYERGG